MKKTATLFLLFALVATGMWAQPAPPPDTSFDVIVNGTLVAPGGQLPDAEEGVPYQYANVVMDGAVDQQGDWVFQLYSYNSGVSTPIYPYGIYPTAPTWHTVPPVIGVPKISYIWGSPSSAITPGTYTIGLSAKFWNLSAHVQYSGAVQFYTIEIRPYGYGVTYPPPPPSPPGGSSDKSSGGSDSSCSTVAGSGPLFGGTLAIIFGALFWRREKKPWMSPAHIR